MQDVIYLALRYNFTGPPNYDVVDAANSRNAVARAASRRHGQGRQVAVLYFAPAKQ